MHRCGLRIAQVALLLSALVALSSAQCCGSSPTIFGVIGPAPACQPCCNQCNGNNVYISSSNNNCCGSSNNNIGSIVFMPSPSNGCNCGGCSSSCSSSSCGCPSCCQQSSCNCGGCNNQCQSSSCGCPSCCQAVQSSCNCGGCNNQCQSSSCGCPSCCQATQSCSCGGCTNSCQSSSCGCYSSPSCCSNSNSCNNCGGCSSGCTSSSCGCSSCCQSFGIPDPIAIAGPSQWLYPVISPPCGGRRKRSLLGNRLLCLPDGNGGYKLVKPLQRAAIIRRP